MYVILLDHGQEVVIWMISQRPQQLLPLILAVVM